jgi:hypothetical protein
MVMRAVCLLALVACQGNRGNDSNGSSPPPPPPKDTAQPATPDVPDPPPTPEDAKPEEPEPPSKVIADLGAIPAWQAVIERSQLLGRRGQHGVVFGRIGPAVMVAATAGQPDAGLVASPYTWLVDDTEGNGALGIRVALANRPVKAGDRVALGGAWQLDDERHWFWKVDVVQPLAAAPASETKDPPPATPSHTIENGGLPYGARTLTLAKESEAAYFMIVGPPPATEGDGWPVANELGDPVYGLLRLPGERPAYGSLDMRSPDEKWQLKKGQVYWVRLGEIRKREGKPALLNARTAPVRVK